MANLLSFVPELTGASNYHIWSVRMISCLTYTTVQDAPVNCTGWAITEGTFTQPVAQAPVEVGGPPANQREIDAWISTRNLAFASINARLADHLLEHGQTTPNALWTYLEQRFGTPEPARVFADYQQTLSFRISGQKDPSDEIRQLLSIYSRLAAQQCNTPEWMRAFSLLSAVPPIWSHIVSAILANTTLANLTFDNVSAAICSEWNRCQASSTAAPARDSGVQRKGNNPNQSQQRQGKGNKSGGQGAHQKRQSNQQGRGQGNNSKKGGKRGGKNNGGRGNQAVISEAAGPAGGLIPFPTASSAISPTRSLVHEARQYRHAGPSGSAENSASITCSLSMDHGA